MTLKKVRADDFYPFFSNALCTVFVIFIETNQINGQDEDNYHSNSEKIVNEVMNNENVISKQLVNRALKDTYIDLMDTNCDTFEECRIICTTYRNLKGWFVNCMINLEGLDFALRD